MEGEKTDRFDSLIKLCQPTSSQEAELDDCPFGWIVKSDRDPDLSSPSPSPTEPAGIVMVSGPDSGPIDQRTPQDDAELEFQTPPEQQARFSSEDHYVDAGEPPTAFDPGDSLRTVDLSEDTLVVGADELRKNGVLEEELDNDSVLKKKGVSEEDMELEWDGETMPIGETEPTTVEVEGSNNVHDTDVINMETEEIGEELTTVNLGEDSVEKLCNENVVVGENADAQKTGETPGFTETPDLLVAGASEEFVRVSKNCDEGKTSEYREVVEVTESEKACNNTGGDGDLCSFMNMEGIDEFKYVNDGVIERKRKERVCGVDSRVGGQYELPLSMKGKEQNIGSSEVVGNVGMINGFFDDLLEVLKPVVPKVDRDSEDVDFLEIAKRRGLTFPQPRWWSP
ncbi:uncharacterized protein LOC111374647 [Olea europaea var. sylvestris]|uniref:uncharacterized protein LOC111374647 n=1 Tax=Olea europaea var. sylvestris TaxID=158386 RepID=UPI000C1D2B63|nr:uncharacterized protein LOC111374647 [Olea europaea var. sylvestris]XP_022853129.1 uncharacterized protein LOC111374647 [Olea europaea var. sylvestris]